MTTTALTDNQRQILEHALDHTAGRIEWFPDSIKGGARAKVLQSLVKRGLVVEKASHHLATASAYDALGRERPARKAKADQPQPVPRQRDGSKQAQVIDMLKRPQGATIAQVSELTGWQSHTVRGFFSAGLKKKLGLNVVSNKAEGGERVYQIE